MHDGITRRDFLRLSGLAAAGIVTGGWLDSSLRQAAAQALDVRSGAALPVVATTRRSRVAMIRSRAMSAGDSLNPVTVGEMLDAAIAHVMNTADAVEAWGRLAGPGDVVALKVNMQAAPRFYTDPVVTYAVVDRLLRAGVPAPQIIIYDRLHVHLRHGGYTINTGGPGVRCYGTQTDYVGPFSYGVFSGRLSRIVAEKASVLINLPVVKHHGNAGITGALKNHYGTIEFPRDHHRNGGDPDIAHINMLPEIRRKQRLIVCDGSFGCFNGGPYCDFGDQWRYNRLLVSRDPVAVDTLIWQIVAGKREQAGLPPVRPPAHVATAATLGLGTNNLARMILLNREL